MNFLTQRYIVLLVFQLTLNLYAQPILIQSPNQTFLGSSLSNLRLRNLSPDGDEAIFTVDYSYDGINGPTARLIPVISDKNQPKVSGWFGADPVSISTGHGTISLRVKFFNDDPGVPPEVTTDHVKIMMLSDGGKSRISQGNFYRTVKWGHPQAQAAKATPPQTQTPTPLQAQADLKAGEEAALKAEAEEKARQAAEATRLAEEKAKAEDVAKVSEEARLKTEAEEKAKAASEAQRAAAAAAAKTGFFLSSKAKTKIANIDVVNRNMDRTETTITVDYTYAKEDDLSYMGLDVVSTGEPRATGYFSSPPVAVSRGSHNLIMFPVRLNAGAAAKEFRSATLPTDKVWIYLTDATGVKSYVYEGTVLLVWHLSGGAEHH